MFKICCASLFLIAITFIKVSACTNFLLTRGATQDGSTMITYSADSHVLYGELYHWPAGTWPAGTMMDIYEWDTGKYMGKIPQAAQTYNVIGNIDEHIGCVQFPVKYSGHMKNSKVIRELVSTPEL